MGMMWVLATLIGLLVSLMYVGHYLGISVFIVTVLLVVTVYKYKKTAGLVIGRHFYIIGAYMLLLSPVFAVTTVPVVRFWSGFILTVLLFTLSICETTFLWPKWLVNLLTALFGSLSNFSHYFSKGNVMASSKKKQLVHVLIGLLVAIPILLVAGGLLASADAVMEDLLSNVFEQMRFDDMGVWVWRIIVFVLVSAVLFGYSVWFKISQENNEPIAENLPKRLDVIPPTVSGTVLVLLNVLYLVFAYIQIKFLFMGAASDISGYNYAEYARSGFFELVTLSIFNTIGILAVNKFTKAHLFNRLSLSVTVGCTFIMIASSAYKMKLYETAYGYTQLRLYVYMILAFMVVFMAFIALGIWKSTYRVIEWAIIVGLCYFLVISYVNVDKIIVENNVARYEETGDMDLHYLFNELSEDAVPYVVEFIESNPSQLDSDWAPKRYEDIQLWAGLKSENRWFFEFNYRQYRALKAVNSQSEGLGSKD